MTNSNDGVLRQMTERETVRLVSGVLVFHVLRPVTDEVDGPQLYCSCGEVFPVSWEPIRQHFYDRIGEAAEALGARPADSWGWFAKTETASPVPSAEERPYYLGASVAGANGGCLPTKIILEEASEARMTDENWETLQELLNAIGAIPSVSQQVDAFLRGRGFDDPEKAFLDLRGIAF